MESLFEVLGREEGIRKLVDRFYDLMETTPDAKQILEMHPSDLSSSRQKLFEFLVGWSGGPPLFENKYGHPRLRMRHAPFAIGERERDMWLFCMRQAIKDTYDSIEIYNFLDEKFSQIADFMRNDE